MKSNSKSRENMRLNIHLRAFAPLIIGVLLGYVLSLYYIPKHEDVCQQPDSDIFLKSKRFYKQTKGLLNRSITSSPVHVKPKANHFNYDFRPYFVYSELGFRFQLVVGIMTSEVRLNTFGIAINNTWLQDVPRAIYFIPYSKTTNFHERYNHNLNLNVVQLSDIMEDSSETEFSFRILQYLKDHFANNYYWFMLVNDDVYLNQDNLLRLIQSVNSSMDMFIGQVMKVASKINYFEPLQNNPLTNYCYDKSGILLSQSSLVKLFQGPVNSNNDNFGMALAKSLHQNAGVSCLLDDNLSEKFHMIQQKDINIKSSKELQKAAVIYQLKSANQIIEIHKQFTLMKLQDTYDKVHKLQKNINQIQTKLPNDVPEKTLHWPIGFPSPFKPSSRFEVIQWTYFDKKSLYGYSDVEPVSPISSANKKDLTTILYTAKKALLQEKIDANSDYKLVNGYRRLDPQRGAEYIIDMRIKQRNTNIQEIRRIHLLHPFTKVEALPMPAATEQKGIHLVLPVLREGINQYERFLQMYKRVCLQTGENVVLLTVFINIRDGMFEGEDKDDPFVELKNLIARYKHSYMWAQLPWLQVGVKQPSPVLIMDIVSMKLPSNALIFLVSLTTDFTTNFLNRCRVNVVSGIQVFFPIPFVEYDPDIVYKTKQKPTFVEIHRDNGCWHRKASEVACFNNKDYKDQRMLKTDFLDESQPMEKDILGVFNESKLLVFKAIDAELRKRFHPVKCLKGNITLYKRCTADAGEHHGSRAQLAQLLFKRQRL